MPNTTELDLHKNQEGTYIISFFDLFGRRIKDKEVLEGSLTSAINTGNDELDGNEDVDSFIIKRTLYNSKQHPNRSTLRF